MLIYSAPVMVSLDSERGKTRPQLPVSEICNQHHCQLFDVPTLLYDRRWLGTDRVLLELVNDDKHLAQATVNDLEKGFRECDIAATCSVPRNGAVLVSNLKFDKKEIDPAPILQVGLRILWCEPNKLEYEDIKFSRVQHPGEIAKCFQHELQKSESEQKALMKVLKILQQVTPQVTSQSKGGSAFNALEKSHTAIGEIIKSRLNDVTEVTVCTVCERIITVMANTLLPPDFDPVQIRARVAQLQQKLDEASGNQNKQKRKKLQRKIKMLETSLENIQVPDEWWVG